MVDLKTQEESNQRVCTYLLDTLIGTVIGGPGDSGGELPVGMYVSTENAYLNCYWWT